MEKSLTEVVYTSKLFEGLSISQLDWIIVNYFGKRVTYKKNDKLTVKENSINKLYLLLSGNVTIARGTPSGKRILGISITKQGDLIGDILYLTKKESIWNYVIVLEDSELIEISCELFSYSKKIDADIQNILLRNMLVLLAEKVCYTDEKLCIMLEETVRKKIIRFFSGIVDDENMINLNTDREVIADYLNIARPSLSRELSRMQNEGIININRNEIQILNMQLFEQYLE